MGHPIRDDPAVKNLLQTSKFSFLDTSPPIEDEVIDPEELKLVFSNFPIIPYSGTAAASSHRLVDLLYRFRTMSTTFGGVLKDLKTYSLKGKIDAVTYVDSIIDVGDEKKISDAEKISLNNIIKENFIFEDGSMKALACLILESWISVGQYGVEVNVKKVLDVEFVTIKFIAPTKYCFTRNFELGLGKEVAISNKWTDDYLRKYPPKIIGVYPLEYTYKDGSVSTFFFEKNGGELYGRPDDLSCITAKYNEWKLEQYLTKKNKKLWMPDVLIETEDPETHGSWTDDESAKDKGYLDAVDRIERQFTNVGDDTRSAIITNRPYGATRTFVHEFKGLQNADQIQKFQDIFENRILAANSWPIMLFKMQGKTGFSTNEFMDVFSIKVVTTIQDLQSRFSGFINQILHYGFKKKNISSDLGIKFSSPLQDLLDEYSNTKRGDQLVSSKERVDGDDAAD